MQDEASESNPREVDSRDVKSRLIHFPYDSILSLMFDDEQCCADFVLDHGDKDLVRHLAGGPASTKPTRQVGNGLKRAEADSRFRLATTDEEQSDVEVTVEFDSGGNDTKAFKKTLGYVLRGVLRWLRSGEAPLASSAFLVSTGERPYSGPRSLGELVPGLDSMGDSVLNFIIKILDFSHVEPEDLVSKNQKNSVILLTVYFAAASRRARADFDDWMEFIFSQPNVQEDVLDVVVFFMRCLYGDDIEVAVEAKLRANRPDSWREIMAAAALRIAEAVRPEHEARARSKILTSSLESVFGTLPNSYKQKISEAGEQDILRWTIRFHTASSLDQIFDGPDED